MKNWSAIDIAIVLIVFGMVACMVIMALGLVFS